MCVNACIAKCFSEELYRTFTWQNFLNYTTHISQCNCPAIDVCLGTATPGHRSDCFFGLSRTLLCTQPSLEVHWEPNLTSLPTNQCFEWSLPMCGNKICLLRMFKTVWSCDLCMDVVLYTPLPVSCSVVFWGAAHVSGILREIAFSLTLL